MYILFVNQIHILSEKVQPKEEPGSAFQRRRVDVLLVELAKKFPPKIASPPQLEKQTTGTLLNDFNLIKLTDTEIIQIFFFFFKLSENVRQDSPRPFAFYECILYYLSLFLFNGYSS